MSNDLAWVDDAIAAIERVPVVFASLADKLMDKNPSWEQLPAVLTAEERAVFVALLGLRL